MNDTPESNPLGECPAVAEADENQSGNIIDLLLRHPASLLKHFDGPRASSSMLGLVALALSTHLLYGLVVGSFSGGMQWWAAPLKIVCGIGICGAICFPSLYILVCLSGARARVPQVAGMLLCLLALSGVFLAGFAPIAWVFSQSSNYVSFIAPVHYLVWFIAIFASARVLHIGMKHWQARHTGGAGLWILVLLVTALQMTTVLRPIVGPATKLFEPERQFFLQHWGRTFQAEASKE